MSPVGAGQPQLCFQVKRGEGRAVGVLLALLSVTTRYTSLVLCRNTLVPPLRADVMGLNLTGRQALIFIALSLLGWGEGAVVVCACSSAHPAPMGHLSSRLSQNTKFAACPVCAASI